MATNSDNLEENLEVVANGFTFRYRCAGRGGTKGNVLCLHGFPAAASTKFFDPLMVTLASKGYCCVAYDQRGYSPNAAPDDPEDYHYDKLRDDVFVVAESLGWGKFHLVGHDHGGLLGWYCAGSPRGIECILSYTALTIPHLDAFSLGLYGKDADTEQQLTSQYFSMFVPVDSATTGWSFLHRAIGSLHGFKTPQDTQKALWWYYGAAQAGVLAFPPTKGAWELFSSGYKAMGTMRAMLGHNDWPEGVPQKSSLGMIHVPVLYVGCSRDPCILGTKPFALRTSEYCQGGYTYFEADCGHDMGGKRWHEGVVAAIVERISDCSA